MDNAHSVYACDIDGDGDNDVLSASRSDDKIAWYENNGNGNFGSQQIITTSADYSQSVYACDIDGDGDNDVLSASGIDNKIAWYENSPHPEITEHPANQTGVGRGAEVNFSVTANNVDTYQWQTASSGNSYWLDLNNNTTYSGTASNTLTVTTAFYLNNKQYRCYVTNGIENAVSNAATLTFETEDPSFFQQIADQTVDADANCEAFLIDYTGDVTATDNCDTDLTITLTPVAGTTISGATNQVTITAEDDAGNSTSFIFNVEVVDNTNPTVTCIADQEVYADETHNYEVSGTEFDPAETDDNCETASIINDFNSMSTLDGALLPEGNTTIVWTVTDTGGNENTCSFDVLVNAYSGVETLQQNGISIYPNPVTGKFAINFSKVQNFGKLKFQIKDITGKILIEKTEIQQNEKIDLSSFESGIYIISINTDNEVFNSKIIKK